jgi:hypothetical protein
LMTSAPSTREWTAEMNTTTIKNNNALFLITNLL